MKGRKKTIISVAFALTALTVYAFAYYLLNLPHSPWAAFGFLAVFAIDFAALVLADVLDEGNKSN